MKEETLAKKIAEQAKKFKLRANKGRDDNKRHDLVRPDERKAMYTAYDKLEWSYAKIGSVFDRDARTVKQYIEQKQSILTKHKEVQHSEELSIPALTPASSIDPAFAEVRKLIKGGREAPPGYELLEALPRFIDESKVLNRLSESLLMDIQGVPQYLYRLSQECHTPGLILCSREYLQRGMITWIECLGPCYLFNAQRPSVCMSWEQCLRQHYPTLHEHRLCVGSNRDNTVWMRLPSRFKYPDVEKLFPALHDISFYGEICKVEELGAIWLHRCEQLLSYLEHPDTDSVTAAVENSAPGPTRKLPADVYEPALQALNAWDHQASAVRAWGELLKERQKVAS